MTNKKILIIIPCYNEEQNIERLNAQIKAVSIEGCNIVPLFINDCSKDGSLLVLKKIGVKAHRYSIEWCKIEPEEGVYDLDALRYYITSILLGRYRGFESQHIFLERCYRLLDLVQIIGREFAGVVFANIDCCFVV